MKNKLKNFIQMPFIIKVEKIRRIIGGYKKCYYGCFGKRSIIMKPLLIYNRKNIFIGDNVTIRQNLRIEPIKKWYDKKYDPKIIIGDNTNIEQNCHLTCANRVEIGKSVSILAYSCITDIIHTYQNIDKGVMEQAIEVKKTSIGDECFIGMGSRIMAGVNIGKHCIIGANSVVCKDIPDYSVAVGSPAKIIKRYNFKNAKWESVNAKEKKNEA